MTGMKRPVHPGKILADELDQRSISARDLAEEIGIDAAIIADIITCKSPLTPEIAALLETTLGVEGLFWANLQAQYDQAVSALATNETKTK